MNDDIVQRVMLTEFRSSISARYSNSEPRLSLRARETER